MDDMTKEMLRTIVTNFPTVSPAERHALLEFLEKGYFQPSVDLSEPHLLTANQSAAWLGISADSFARARDAHPVDLVANEIYPGHRRWSKSQLLDFANRHIRKNTQRACSEDEKAAELCR